MNKQEKENFKDSCRRARSFVYKNARPVELARWKYHFEDGNREEVLDALACYQNEDGGFGNGLEPDCWNQNSSPIQTWEATEILWEINMDQSDAKHPIVQGILDYLSSGQDFDEDNELWSHTVETNNDFPHADWWHYPHSKWWEDTAVNRFAFHYNPTAALAGFVLYFEKKDSELYDLAMRIAKNAINVFLQIPGLCDQHVIFCFHRLHEYIIEAGLEAEFPMEKFTSCLHELVHSTITQDINLYITMWGDVGICRPSRFILSKDSDYFEANQDISRFECEFIAKTQLEDGSWEVPWDWGKTYPEAWGVAKNWWKSRIIIENLLFWCGIEDIE